MKRFLFVSLAVLCFAPAISAASVPTPDHPAVISALSAAPDAPPAVEITPASITVSTTRTTQVQKAPVMPQDRILQFFAFAHLPPAMQAVSKPFHDLAHQIADSVPSNPERSVALRKLLEAKDAAVRAGIYKEPQADPEWCKVCPHPVGLHNPDGSCGCGMDCARELRARKA